MIRTIVVGVDGSRGSTHALEWAAGRAQELDAEVVAVYGVRALAEFVMSVPPFDQTSMIDDLGRALDNEWSAPLRHAGVKYRTELIEADPVNAILGVAEGSAADMIVLGAQGHGGIVDRLLGGVTYKIAHRARQPVVIVPEEPR